MIYMELCNICGKNPRYLTRLCCRECLNNNNRDKYKNNPFAREQKKRTDKRSRLKRWKDPETKKKLIQKSKDFFKKTDYQRTEPFYMSQIKYHLRKLSLESLKEVLWFIYKLRS